MWESWEGIRFLIESYLHWHSTVVFLNYVETKIQLVFPDRPARCVKQPQYTHPFKGARTLAQSNPQAQVIFKAKTKLGTGQFGWMDQVVYIVRLVKFASYLFLACYMLRDIAISYITLTTKEKISLGNKHEHLADSVETPAL